MKRIFIAAVGLIVLGLMVVALKGRKGPPQGAASEANPEVQAVDAYLLQNPDDPAAPQLRRLSAASVAIDTYLEKHSSGRGIAPLRRLSAALKTRPAQVQTLAETAASRIKDGSISKEDAAVLEKAAALAEQKGLSPREMAEFSKKYMMGVGVSRKPVSAPLVKERPPAPLPSFEGKRRLTYTFTGVARCAEKPCTDIRISVRVSSGKWVETRTDAADGQGHYSLQMPVLSAVSEKVRWRLEAYSKDLRKAELTGGRVTAGADRAITVQNDLVLL